MPFQIKNLTASNISLDDIGTTIFASSILDLRVAEDHQVIAKSDQIRSLVNSSSIAILDASGSQITAPAGSQLLDRVNIPFGPNDPAFVTITTDIANNSSSIAAVPSVSVLNDISDVNVPSPASGQGLIFNASSGNWEAGNTSQGITLAFEWRFSTNTNTGVDPGNNRFRYNNASPLLVTDIALDDLDRSGFDVGNIIGQVKSGDQLYVQQKNSSLQAQLFSVTGSATDSVGYWNIPVSAQQVGLLPGNNEDCALIFLFTTGSVDQNLWQTIAADTGSQAAGAPTATLTTTGVGGITTAMAGSLLTISGSAIGGNGDDLAGVLAALSASQALTVSVFNTINWDLTQFENASAVVAHDPVTNNSRITALEPGAYLAFFSLTVDPPTQGTVFDARAIRNGVASAVLGSERSMNEDAEANDLSNVFMVTMASNDYLELQVQPDQTTATLNGTSNFGMMRMKGSQGADGPTGPAGAGANIIVQDEGVNASGTPSGTINFTGVGVSVSTTDASSVEVIIPGASTAGAPEGAKVTHSLDQNTTSAVPFTLAFNTEEFDTDTMHDNSTNNSRLTINTAGKWLFGFNGRWENNATGQRHVRLIKNGTTIVGQQEIQPTTDEQEQCVTFPIQDASATNFFEIEILQNSGGTLDMETAGLPAPTFWAQRQGGAGAPGADGADGADGATGPAGSGTTINVQENGSNVTGTPFEVLDFIGGITTTNVGGSTVTISGSSFFLGSTLPALSDVRSTTTASAIDGEVLTFNASAGLWENQTAGGGAGTDNDAVQARRTIAASITTAFQDITFDATDVETDAAVIEHDNTNTDDIDIKVTGTYEISYEIDFTTTSLAPGDTWTIIARVRLDDAGTGINGSEARKTIWEDNSVSGTDHEWHLCNSFIVDITAPAFVTLQIDGDDIAASGGVPTTRAGGITLKAKRLT